MKGITPIISIIVLLLITISLAGAAYVFLSGTMFGFIGQAVSGSGACIAGTTARIQVTNMGTENLDISGCNSTGSIAGTEQRCTDLTILRVDGGLMDGNFDKEGIAQAKANQLDYAVFRDNSCTTPGNPERCEYLFTRAGELQPVEVIVSCSG